MVEEVDALIDDALEMEKIVGTKGYGAILRLLKRKKDALFFEWASDKGDQKYTKDYCRGQIELMEAFAGDIAEMIGWARELIRQREETARLGRTPGGGDLAV